MYQIKSNRFEFDSYVGCTTNFKERERTHKKACLKASDKRHNYRVYQFIRANGGWDEWTMIKLFDVTVKYKKELDTIERQCIEDYGGTLNVQVPTRTNKEWREQNKDKIYAQRQQYRQRNRDNISQKKKMYNDNNQHAIKAKKKRYYLKNREKFLTKAKVYREKHKEIVKVREETYRKRNKDKLQEYFKSYREKNKEIIKARESLKEECECGSVVRRADMARHKRTKKHQNFVL